MCEVARTSSLATAMPRASRQIMKHHPADHTAAWYCGWCNVCSSKCHARAPDERQTMGRTTSCCLILKSRIIPAICVTRRPWRWATRGCEADECAATPPVMADGVPPRKEVPVKKLRSSVQKPDKRSRQKEVAKELGESPEGGTSMVKQVGPRTVCSG